ncbi:MAG TPA: NADH-quinone oxidoreductase subunit L [Ruminiclostridium sp.]|nr:NADH-quinone oxidoreductase subunit L [Ruminiclostridium sp.]
MQGAIPLLLLLLIPAVTSLAVLFLKKQNVRTVIVTISSCAMIASAVVLCINILRNGPFTVSAQNAEWAGVIVTVIDAATLLVTLYFGFKLKEWKIVLPAIAQVCAVFYLEVVARPEEPRFLVNVDNLSLVMTLIVSIIGPLVAIFAIGYMKQHEEHQKLKETRQHLFFAVIFLFLFAMNGICITDNLMHLYAFWEITTLCSFLLIGHDRKRDSFISAKRALWLNSFGGLFFVLGIIFIINSIGTISISEIIDHGSASSQILIIGLMFICCAGFVKSAQLPFQSWLLGAMVAPTPVSALLHSSTMVKAGVYVIVRFSPVFGGHMPGILVSMVGAFTFVAAAALAISQSNGKRVLAFSTISNLGLIIACAGLGGPQALTTAILLIIFHAVSKGLLFLCMGTVELKIGSRNIEDMFGIFSKMPYTTSVMILGMLSMMLPPFGVLITKWLAIEASVNVPPVMFLLVLGSAFTIAFWVKWLGAVTTIYKTGRARIEDIPMSIKIALGIIAVFIPVLTVLMPQINNYVIWDSVSQLLKAKSVVFGSNGGIYSFSEYGISGGFGGIILLIGVIAAAAIIFFVNAKFNKPRIVAPYACGTLGDKKGRDFYGPQDKIEKVRLHNYYFSGIFGEKKLMPIASVISAIIILIMFGVS